MMTILTFHAVTDARWFDGLISWLKGHWRFVPIESVAEYFTSGKRFGHACHLTVDDGDRSFTEVMLPVLKKHAVPASLFVSAKMSIDGGSFWFQDIEGYDESVLSRIAASVLKVPVRLLSEYSPQSILKTMSLCQIRKVIDTYQNSFDSQTKIGRNLSVPTLREVVATGLVSVGAHTMNHPILANEDDESCEAEISDSVCCLASLLGRPVEYFAYPNGIPDFDFGDREERMLGNSGIKLAFTTESRHLSGSDTALRVPRIAISDGESKSRVMAKMLLGSNWGRLRRIASVGEYVERRRLRRTLDGLSATDKS
jgi:peptidoglycan/xylan/chitin deacetylase (PgdA/CDA1 family)